MESNQHRSCFQVDGRCNCTETLVPLNELREKNLFSDAVLRLEDGGVFPVHRLILSMRSAYFRTLFTTTLHTSEETDILLHEVSSDMMTLILDYVYFREVDIHSDNACQLLATADYLCIPDVPKLCCDFLKIAMDTDNCIGILLVARFHFCTGLETRARSFVLSNFVQVSQKSEELLELPVEELQAITESEELNVPDERVVWECILRWINHDPDNRKGHIAGLLKGVRLGLLGTKFLRKKVSKHPYVTENLECRPVISETLTFLDDVERSTNKHKDFVTPWFARPRNPLDILFVIGGFHHADPTDVIEAYDARADRWIVVEAVGSIDLRRDHGTAVVGFDIYVIGGGDGRFGCLSSCCCFNAFTKTCREVAPMNKRRENLMVAVLRGAVYAMGGEDICLILSSVEKYDCKTNQWSLINPMNTQRASAAAAVLNDKIYVAGGRDGEKYLNSVEVYDPDTNRWTFVAPMLTARMWFACVAFHGCLYALGGTKWISNKLSTEKYDPAEDTWTEFPDMDFKYRDIYAEVIDDMIFVNTGYLDFRNTSYKYKENQWHKVRDMNVGRSHMSTCVVKNLPNASDYTYKHRDKLMVEKRKKSSRRNVKKGRGET